MFSFKPKIWGIIAIIPGKINQLEDWFLSSILFRFGINFLNNNLLQHDLYLLISDRLYQSDMYYFSTLDYVDTKVTWSGPVAEFQLNAKDYTYFWIAAG